MLHLGKLLPYWKILDTALFSQTLQLFDLIKSADISWYQLPVVPTFYCWSIEAFSWYFHSECNHRHLCKLVIKASPYQEQSWKVSKIGNRKEPLNLPSIFLILNSTKMLVIKMLITTNFQISISLTNFGCWYDFKTSEDGDLPQFSG